MLVENWMSKELLTTRRSQSLTSAQQILATQRVRQLPVVERSRLVGIVTDRDLRAATEGARKVEDVMSFDPHTIEADESVDVAAQRLRTWKVNALPVVRKGRLVGIITTSDVLAAFVALSGVAEPSYRLVIVPNRRAKPQSVEAVIESTGSQVRWIHESGKGKGREVHARIVTGDIESVTIALEAAGHTVSATVTSPAADRVDY